MKTRPLIVLFFVLGLVLPVSSQTGIPTEGIVLENEKVRFEFEAEGMGLATMIDKVTGFNHIKAVDGKHLLWEVAMGVGRQIYTVTNNYKPCSYYRIDSLSDGGKRLVMEWNELRWWLEDAVLTVQITVDLPPNDGVAEWRIFVENRSDYWGLWSVLFPIINGFPSSGEYDIARPVFASGGRLLPSWKEAIWGRYPGGVWPMQFMSLNAGTNAVYFAGKDSEARAKEFVIEPIKGLKSERYPVIFEGRRHRTYISEPGERLFMRHFPDNMGEAGSDYPDLYPIVFGVYQGGWVEAAHRYRPWALKQKWARLGRISERTDIPESMKKVALWIRGNWEWTGAEGARDPQAMNTPLLEAQKRLGVPIGIKWYRWHHMPFDQNYPHFLPAKDGFKQRVKELTEAGIIVMPYINGSSADMNITDWEDFSPHAVRDEAGGIRLHFYSDRAGRLLSMCAHQDFWQDTISKLVDDIITEYGVSGVYIDQVSGLYHELCFDSDHDHPIGGGSYWADGCRNLLRKSKSVAGKDGRHSIITSEGNSEIFFDLLDANLTWSQPSDQEIPLMPLVYSGYTLFFGSPCDYTKSANYFRYAQGQAFIDGRQNGWMDLGLFKPEHKEKAEYFRRCGHYRVAGRKFLTYGRMIRPLEPSNDILRFSEPGFGWAMYEEQRTTEVPGAEARLWQAEDGHLAVIMANYLDREVAFAIELDPADYGLDSETFQLSDVDPMSTVSLGTAERTVSRIIKLGPQQLKIIVIAPQSSDLLPIN